MKKQLRVEISGSEPMSIDLVENEAIHVRIDNNATKFLGANEPETTFRVAGSRWADQGFFNFEWKPHELQIGDSVTVHVVEGETPSTAPHHEEKYIEPEKECSFCEKKASEVEHLIEASLFVRICNECVAVCQKLLEEKKSEQSGR